MIDLHTHLLPNMDDGAKYLEDALKMTEMLYAQGVIGAACTSHFDPSEETMELFTKRRNVAMSRMGESKINLFPAS